MNDSDCPLDVVMHYSDVLWESSARREAIVVLDRFKASNHPVLMHRLASRCAADADWQQAAQYFAKLVDDHPEVRQFRIDGARNFLTLRQPDKAWNLIEPMVTGAFSLPHSADDFYYDGFANWLVGLVERANYDFQRSCFSADQFYERLEPLGILTPDAFSNEAEA